MTLVSSDKTTDLFIIVGEKSGDLHGEKLVRALLEQDPSLQIAGVGGPLMRSLRFQSVLPMEAFQVMGFIDVFKALPNLLRHFYFLARKIRTMKPRMVITIDYPGLNLRLCRHLRRRGFQGKWTHFICPSVWAWGKKRIPLMTRNLDLLLCILPFESQLFASSSLSTRFVGHPLIERLAEYHYKPFEADPRLIALFPGSRRKEIERNLPLMLAAALKAKEKDPSASIAISVSEERFHPLISQIIHSSKHPSASIRLVPSHYAYELMRAAHVAIAKSGTVTLELALHHVPTVVVYAVSCLDQFIAYHLLRIRLPFYCLVNIIAGKKLFPELIGSHLTLSSLSQELASIREDTTRYAQIQKECHELRLCLGEGSTARQAATEILHLLK